MSTEVHSDRDFTADVKAGSDRGFGTVFCVIFVVIGLWPLLDDGLPRWWALGAGAGFLAAALLTPRILAPLNRQWMRSGIALSRITTPVLMALVYISTVTPIAIIMRMLRKDLLRLRRDPSSDSYWIGRSPAGPQKGTMRNQF